MRKSIYKLSIDENMGTVSIEHKQPDATNEDMVLELAREDIQDLMKFLAKNYSKIASREDF